MLPALSLPKGGGAIRGIGEKFSVDRGDRDGVAERAAAGVAGAERLRARSGRSATTAATATGRSASASRSRSRRSRARPTRDCRVTTTTRSRRVHPLGRRGSGPEPRRRARAGSSSSTSWIAATHWSSGTARASRGCSRGSSAHTAATGGAEHWRGDDEGQRHAHLRAERRRRQVVDPDRPPVARLHLAARGERATIAATSSATTTRARTAPASTRRGPSERSRFDYSGADPGFRRDGAAIPEARPLRQPRARAGDTTSCSSWCSTTASTRARRRRRPRTSPGRCASIRSRRYRAGFEVRTYRLCQRVLMFHHLSGARAPLLVRSTDFSYEPGPAFTYLRRRHAARVSCSTAPARWSSRRRCRRWRSTTRDPVGERRADRCCRPRAWKGSRGGVDGAHKQWVDLDGEGIPGVLDRRRIAPGTTRRTTAAVMLDAPRALPDARRRRARWRAASSSSSTSAATASSTWSPTARRSPAIATRTTDGDFEPLRAFPTLPNIDWHDPNLRFIDLDGDGLRRSAHQRGRRVRLVPLARQGRLRGAAADRVTRATRTRARRWSSPTEPRRSSSPT